MDLKKYILEVKDFPKPGVGFKDITPIVQDAEAFGFVVNEMAAWARVRTPDIIVGIESRGFLFGAALARELKLGMTIIRKKGKLPRETVSIEAPNEYAVEHFEMHRDAVKPGQRVLIVDDLIATGSSSSSAIKLVRKLEGNVVGFAAVVALGFLGGEANIGKACPDVDVLALVRY
ncbi:MAG: adenine phosphoribosyltransferase [Candidatus Aminicenantes bacterium]|nr:adenine phosphoribosyltransferase [Candidatus Aminicenantes bacterium]